MLPKKMAESSGAVRWTHLHRNIEAPRHRPHTTALRTRGRRDMCTVLKLPVHPNNLPFPGSSKSVGFSSLPPAPTGRSPRRSVQTSEIATFSPPRIMGETTECGYNAGKIAQQKSRWMGKNHAPRRRPHTTALGTRGRRDMVLHVGGIVEVMSDDLETHSSEAHFVTFFTQKC